MTRNGRTGFVMIRCASCGSAFLVRKESIKPRMYCTLGCIDSDLKCAKINA